MRPIKKILCPVDFLQHSDMVGEYAAMLAKSFSAEVEVLYVSLLFSDLGGHHGVSPAQMQGLEKDLFDNASKNMEDFLKKHFAGLKVTGRILQGDPAEQIIDHAKKVEADLVVMGTHGRRGISHLVFGSVAEKVVRTSSTPVLTLRPAQ